MSVRYLNTSEELVTKANFNMSIYLGYFRKVYIEKCSYDGKEFVVESNAKLFS